MNAPAPENVRAGLTAGRRFIRDFAGHAGGRGIKGAVLIGLGALLEGAGLLLLVPVLDIVVDRSSDPTAAYVGGLFAQFGFATRIEKLGSLLAVFVGLIAMRAVVLWLRDSALATLRVGFVETQRTRLVNKLASAPWSQLSRLQHARVNHLLSGDILLAGSCVYHVLQGFVALCLIGVQCVLAFLLSPALALISSLLLLAAGGLLVPQVAKSRNLGRAVSEDNLHLASSGDKFLGGLKLAVSQNLQHRFASEFNDTLNCLMARQILLARVQSRAQLGFVTASSLVGAVAILVGLTAVHTTPSVLVVFVVVLARMGAPANQLQQSVQQFMSLLPSYDQIKAMEGELDADPAGMPSASHSPVAPARIVFHRVSNCHPGGDQGVRDVDLGIEPGSFIGITGPSGAGKTTFADLLVGLIPPQSGDIRVGDETMTAEFRLRWRSSIAYVSQDAFLFHDSIRQNLLWANRDATEQDLWSALRVAGAGELVSRLGLDATVGEAGTLISGGERQRLAIARALLRMPVLLVLDEATNAIDIAGERTLLSRLADLEARPAIVLIAHRKESLEFCDRVLSFAEGRLISDVSRKGILHPA